MFQICFSKVGITPELPYKSMSCLSPHIATRLVYPTSLTKSILKAKLGDPCLFFMAYTARFLDFWDSRFLCVCNYYQNRQLAEVVNVTYDFSDFLACDVNNKNYMFNQSSQCSELEVLHVLTHEIDEMLKEIYFKQWINTDGAELITQINPPDNF